MHVLAGEVIGVFAHVERAHEHRVLRLEARNQGGVARGRSVVAIDLGTRQSCEAIDIK